MRRADGAWRSEQAHELIDRWAESFGQKSPEARERALDHLGEVLDECVSIVASSEAVDVSASSKQRAVDLIGTAARKWMEYAEALRDHGNPGDCDLNLLFESFVEFLDSNTIWWIPPKTVNGMWNVLARLAQTWTQSAAAGWSWQVKGEA